MEIFCYQCEQTHGGIGCSVMGNCGKDPATAALQDLVVDAAKGISVVAHRAGRLGAHDAALGRSVLDALFTTVTNVSFDPERLVAQLQGLGADLERAWALYRGACQRSGTQPEAPAGRTAWRPAPDRAGLLAQARGVSLRARKNAFGPDVAGLRELVLYGLKGAAAYAHHAAALGVEDAAVHAWFHEALAMLARPDCTVDELLAAALRCGEMNLEVMGMLDGAHTGRFGHPSPTAVRVTPVAGKAIVVTGHDLADLEALLQQTEGTGVNVYTHGEMLPAHGYPGLRKYRHLVGNYGGAWQDQVLEFGAFPGAIVFTTNCLQAPDPSYRDRVFTLGLVAHPRVRHLAGRDFSAVIAAAQAAPGFAATEPEKAITVGFGHKAVLGVADQVVAAVRSGAIRRFFLIGGCDGAAPGRNYYTELAEAVPRDCVILTLACGKYRFNKLDHGAIGGIPRLLDVGQCNDAYAAVQIAAALARAFGTDVNGLPLSFILSWYEQKAVAVLLSLLHLGVRNIRLGPSLPAFVTPPVLEVLVKKFDLRPITTAREDLAACLGG
jgi:hydroxylamine reductase